MTDASPAAQRVPWHLWLVGTLGLLWNAVGVFDYLMNRGDKRDTWRPRVSLPNA